MSRDEGQMRFHRPKLSARHAVLAAVLPLMLGACGTSYATHPGPCYFDDHAPPQTQFALMVTNPVAAGGVVYVGYWTNASVGLAFRPISNIAALRESDGAVLWRTPDPISASTLALDQGTLILSSAVGMAALSATDGALLWRMNRGAYSYGAPSLVLGTGVLYAVDDDGIYAVRIADGRVLWQTPTPADRVVVSSLDRDEPHLSAPLLAATTLYVGALNGPLMALRAGDGTVIWQTFPVPPASDPTLLPNPTNPVALGSGNIYVEGMAGRLLRVRTSDGATEEVVPGIPASRYLDPVALNGIYYIGVTDDAGTTYTLFTPNGQRLWSVPVKGAPAHILALDGNTLYLSGGNLIALRFSDGAILWTQQWNQNATGGIGADSGLLFMSLFGRVDLCISHSDQPDGIQAFHGSDGSVAWTHRF